MSTMLIDDDPFALKLLAHQLAVCGVGEVTPCNGALDALSLLAQQPDDFDLVFCDLQMPGIDGVEFVRHLARMHYRGHLVLVSAEHTRILHTVRKLAQAHNIVVLATLNKPVAPDQLQQALAAHAAAAATRPIAARIRPGTSVPRSADELRQALAAGELFNHYQPQVHLASGALVGVEALVRWQHPTAGLLYPDAFIGIAEEHGLIDALTDCVLRAALLQARVWLDAGMALQMSVNMSMANLAALDFPDRVARMADAAGVALSSLVLEVTESRLMQDLRAPLEILTRLRLKRIGLSIDDFGTGHSSLAQLRDIPFDELKLDRSFVHGAGQDPALGAIVEATLSMASQLGMKAVAEGVEDRADWNHLQQLGCDLAQGYFIARPMAGDTMQAWCESWTLRRSELVQPGADARKGSTRASSDSGASSAM